MITLKSSEIELKLLPIGATIYELKTKKDGIFQNVVLAHQDEAEYTTGNTCYFGNSCGRFSGRINNAQFTLDGTTYNLQANDGKHNLHGGIQGFSKTVWDYTISEDSDKSTCVFSHSFKHLEEGFPGNIDVKIEYVVHKNSLTINYYATSDQRTYLNLTNHSYFNMGAITDTLYNQTLQLDCTKFIECDEDVIPTGIADVSGTEFDFRQPTKIGDLNKKEYPILKTFNGFDNAFLLDKSDMGYDLYLKDETTGRSLKIQTSYPCVVLYTYNRPVDTQLLDRPNKKHIGMAIEPQFAPNAMNDDRFNIPIVDQDTPYHQTIKYIFNE